jgi:Zn finger protein HypA/HybF involved in hydrogenase expression
VITAVVDTVEEYLGANYGGAAEGKPAPTVTRVALQIGNRSSYLPAYIREIWPVAVKGTSLESAVLETGEIEGRDFLIKEIEVEE